MKKVNLEIGDHVIKQIDTTTRGQIKVTAGLETVIFTAEDFATGKVILQPSQFNPKISIEGVNYTATLWLSERQIISIKWALNISDAGEIK